MDRAKLPSSFSKIACIPVLLLSLIIASGLSHADGASGAGCPSSALEHLSALQKKHPNGASLMAQKLQGIEQKETWLAKNFRPQISEAIEQRLNLKEALGSRGLAPGEKIYWVQQGGLKDLNEKLWNIGGTEHFLQNLDEELSAVIKNEPGLARRIHTNYKDRVLISSLSEADFQKKIITPLRERMAAKMSAEFAKDGRNTSAEWQAWLKQNTKVGVGKNLIEAHLAKFGISNEAQFKEAIVAATKSRSALTSSLKQAGNIDLEELFTQLKKSGGNDEAVIQWLKTKGTNPSTASQLVKDAKAYRDHLALGDFLPMPDVSIDSVARITAAKNLVDSSPLIKSINDPKIAHFVQDTWTAQQAQFLANATESGHIIAADVKGVGIKGLMARDAWLRAGGKLEEIPSIYKSTSEMLQKKVSEVTRGLQEICGPETPIHVYQSGDDLLIALPKMGMPGEAGKLTLDKMNRINTFLVKTPDLYFNVESITRPGDTEAISQAISKARESMFDEKLAAKAH